MAESQIKKKSCCCKRKKNLYWRNWISQLFSIIRI